MSTTAAYDIADVRRRFSSLSKGFAFFDGPGGSQTPDCVGDAIAETLREASANLYAPYETSRRVGEILAEAERCSAAYFNCDPGEITFGINMTTLNFALSRAAARAWQAGDRVLVSALDHDANVAPWLELAHDLELDLQTVAVKDDTTLDLDDLRAKLDDRTRVVAFAAASNAVGTKTPIREISDLAHSVGALSWVDAVHYAAHEVVDVRAMDADVVLCSSYKFCGPHLGFGYVRAAVAEQWRPYKVRPISGASTGRNLATGTFPFEALAGLVAAFGYLEEIGGIAQAGAYELELAQQFLDTLPDRVTLYGLPRLEGRVPTFLATVEGVDADDAAVQLAARDIGVWSHDSWYSVGLYPTLGYEGTSLRIGISHYNSADEVERLVTALGELG